MCLHGMWSALVTRQVQYDEDKSRDISKGCDKMCVTIHLIYFLSQLFLHYSLLKHCEPASRASNCYVCNGGYDIYSGICVVPIIKYHECVQKEM